MIRLRLEYGKDPDAVITAKSGAFYWPSSQSKRKELLSVKRNNPSVYESVYQCRPGQRQGSIFLESDFAYYQQPAGLNMGVANPEVSAWLQQFHMIVAAWDTAFEATSEADHTVGIMAGLLSCEKYHNGEDPVIYGPCEPHLDVYLLDLLREKLDWGNLVARFRSFNRKWNPVVNVVEKRGTGISLYQSMPAVGIAVEGVQVTEGKRARAVDGTEAGSVQGWYRQHRVRLPLDAEWTEAYRTEMKDFTGQDDSADDQVDTSVHLINYAIQIGTGIALMPSGWSPEGVDAEFKAADEYPDFSGTTVGQLRRAEMLAWITMAPSVHEDPFYYTCTNCSHNLSGYCEVQKRRVASLDSCGEFSEVIAAV